MFNSNGLRKFVVAVCLLVAGLNPVQAAGWLPLASATVTQTDSGCLASAGTVNTFTAKGLGNANPNRITAVSINWADSTLAGTAELTSVTVGGNAAQRAVRAAGDDQNSNSEIWWLQLPAGTTGDIVVTSSTNIDAVTIGVYSLIGFALMPSPVSTGTTTANIAYQNKDVVLAAGSRTTNVSTSLSNMTNDFSSACGSGLWGVHASQSVNGNNTLTTNINPSTNNPKIAMALWSTTTNNALSMAFVTGTTGSGSGTATVTFSGISFGTAASTRMVVATFGMALTSLGSTITSVTIGGITATQAAYIENTGQAGASAIFYAAVPTGTTGNIVITASSVLGAVQLGVYRLSGLNSNTPVNTCTVQFTGSSLTNCNTNVSANGFLIAQNTNLLGATSVLAGVTVDINSTPPGGQNFSAGSFTEGNSAETPRTVSVHPGGVDRVTFVTASWR